jgi:hypothetical protein
MWQCIFSIVMYLSLYYVTMWKGFLLLCGDASLFCLYKECYICGCTFFLIMICLLLCHVTIWKCFLPLWGDAPLCFFCLYKECCVCGCAFFSYCDMFVIIPYDHVKKFSCKRIKSMQHFFAYIRDVVLCHFFCLCKVCSYTLACDHRKWACFGCTFFLLWCVCHYTMWPCKNVEEMFLCLVTIRLSK